MKSSSKKSPCPICGRTNGPYCRWDDHRIFCYQGNTCHPPRDLTPGQIVTTDDNVEWGFVAYDKGFSHNSAMFTLHTPREGWSKRPPSIRQRRKQAAAESEELGQLRNDLHDAHILVGFALDCPVLEDLTPLELKRWREIILEAFNTVLSLKPRAFKLKRLDKNLNLVVTSLEKQIKELSYQVKDIDQFLGNTLLDPVAGKGKKLAARVKADPLSNPFDLESEPEPEPIKQVLPFDISNLPF